MSKRRKRLMVSIALLGLIAAPSLLIVPTVLELREAASGLQQEISRAKRLRNPLSASALPGSYVSDSRNAAGDFRRVLQDPLAPTLAGSVYDLFDAMDAWKTDTAKETVTKLNPILSTLQQASSKDLLDYRRDWYSDRADYYAETKVALVFPKLMVAKATFDYGQGDVKSGEEALAAAYRIAHFLGDEPVLFSTLAEIAGRRSLNKEVVRLLERHHSDRNVLRSLQDATRSIPPINLRRMIQGLSYVGSVPLRQMSQRNEWLELMRRGRNEQKGVSETDLFPNQSSVAPVVPKSFHSGWSELPITGGGLPSQALIARHLKFCNDAQESLAGMPGLLGYRSLLADLDKRIQAERGPSFILLKEQVPVFRQVIDSAMVCLAEEEAVRTLIRVFQFRAEKGRFPASASEVPIFRLDPISESPLHIVIDQKEALVYSPGFDGVDHRSKNGNHDDVIVRVSLPKERVKDMARYF